MSRSLLGSLAVVTLTATSALAQTLGPPPPVGGCGQSQSLLFDDGTAETSWKVRNPTQNSDGFSVDFDDMAGTMTVTGIALNTYQASSGTPAGIRYVALCPDNLAVDSTGQTPDLINPLSMLGGTRNRVALLGTPGPAAGFCPGLLTYDTPDVTVPTTGGAHAAMSFLNKDAVTFLCMDQGSNAKRSYFTSTAFTQAATPLAGNLQMRVVGTVNPVGGSGYLTVQNSASKVSFAETDNVVVTFWSTAPVQPTFYLQGIFITGFPFIAVPQAILLTGFENFAPISDLTQGTICGTPAPPCGFAGLSFSFGAFYNDNADLKPNGHGKIKASNLVQCTITQGSLKLCNPCACFGQIDDGTFDGNLWKVQNPAGPADYFNNRIDHFDGAGNPCSTPATYTSIQAMSWDFCGTGPSWAAAGIYGSSTSLGGNTPDLLNPLVQCTTLQVTTATGPTYANGTTYDFPDVNASTNSALANTLVMHTVVQWPLGDSCIWIGSDADGIDDDASSTGSCTVVPSTASFFTLNGYTTPAVSAGVNTMMRITFF